MRGIVMVEIRGLTHVSETMSMEMTRRPDVTDTEDADADILVQFDRGGGESGRRDVRDKAKMLWRLLVAITAAAVTDRTIMVVSTPAAGRRPPAAAGRSDCRITTDKDSSKSIVPITKCLSSNMIPCQMWHLSRGCSDLCHS